MEHDLTYKDEEGNEQQLEEYLLHEQIGRAHV